MPFDLGHLGITKTKWTKFTNMYVDIPSLHAWVRNARRVKAYDSLYQFKSVRPHYEGKKAVHQWGSCILAMSFRRQPRPHLTLYSRSQSLGFSGVADYALLSFVSKEIAKTLGKPQEAITVNIVCANFVMKVVEVIHYLQYTGELADYSTRDGRMGDCIRYYMNYMSQVDEETGNERETLPWRAANRMRSKFRKALLEEYNPLPVDSLTLRGWQALDNEQESTGGRDLRQTQQYVLTRQTKGFGG